MSLFTPSLCAAADVLDVVVEIGGALSTVTARLVVAALDDRHGRLDGDEALLSQATLPVGVVTPPAVGRAAPGVSENRHG